MAWDATDVNLWTPFVGGSPDMPPGIVAYYLKERKKACGCTVVASGDGLAAYAAGADVLTNWAYAWGGVANSIANNLAWIVLEHPGGQQELHQVSTAGTLGDALLAWSESAGFVGGGAAVRPVAADEVRWNSTAAVGFVNLLVTADVYTHIICQDTPVDGLLPWHVMQVAPATGLTLGSFGLGHFPVTVTGDTSPHFTWQVFGGTWWPFSASNTAGYRDPTGAPIWSLFRPGGHTEPAGAVVIPASGSLQVVNPTDGRYRAALAGWWAYDGANWHWRGGSRLLLSPNRGDGAAYNVLLRDPTGEIYVTMRGVGDNDGMCLPGWPSAATCPLPDAGAGVSVLDVELINPMPTSPDVTPPTIAVVSPTPGGLIRRDEAFVVDVTDASGLALIVLTAEIPAGGAHEVVWLKDSFSGPYATGSTRAAIADGYRYTIQRTGGWTAAPTFHVEAVDTAGNVGT